jgi:hypothetical protein
MIFTQINHSLLANVFAAFQEEDLRRNNSVSEKVLCLKNVVRKPFNHYSASVHGCQEVNELLSLQFIIFVVQTKVNQKSIEVDVSTACSLA